MIFLALSLLFICVQGLFALFEMAALSFNRLHLQSRARAGKKRAFWLSQLLKRPSRFFGMTLIGVNAALQLGSESARKFFEAYHIDPDFAFLGQAILVVIFGELTPMFAARRYPSQIAFMLVPIMVFFSRALLPFIWILEGFSFLLQKCMGLKTKNSSYFTREEIALSFGEKKDDLNELTERIFQLKKRSADKVMIPFSNMVTVASDATVQDVRSVLKNHFVSKVAIYKKDPKNIVSTLQVRDLLRLNPHEKVIEKAKAPWFIAENTSLLEIIEQFRRNSQTVSIILDSSGKAAGMLTIDEITAEVFGRGKSLPTYPKAPALYVERTLLGSMTLREFNQEFQADLQGDPEETLGDFIFSKLDHSPVSGDEIQIDAFLFTVEEPQLRSIRTLKVRSRPS